MNKFVLANFTQEFSLAVIRSITLKQSILIVQGVLFVFALFNLQGTVRAPRFCGELAYIITAQSLCQALFLIFLSIFSVARKCSGQLKITSIFLFQLLHLSNQTFQHILHTLLSKNLGQIKAGTAITLDQQRAIGCNRYIPTNKMNLIVS